MANFDLQDFVYYKDDIYVVHDTYEHGTIILKPLKAYNADYPFKGQVVGIRDGIFGKRRNVIIDDGTPTAITVKEDQVRLVEPEKAKTLRLLYE